MTHQPTARPPSRRREILLSLAVLYAAVAALASIRWAAVSTLMGVSESPAQLLLLAFGTVGYTAVGAVILWKRPGHGIGRLALLIGIAFSTSAVLASATAALTTSGLVRPVLPGIWNAIVSLAIAVSDALLVGALAIGTILLIAWFPSGHRTSRLGVVVEALVALTVLAAGLFLVEDPVLRTVRWSPAVGAVFDAAPGVAFFSLISAWVLALIDLLRRYRRAPSVERAQMRWVVAAVASSLVLFVAVMLFSDSVEGLWDLWIVSMMLPVIAIAIAITRYRLYDIDRIVSRSIAYAVVTAVLFATFFVVNVALQRVLGDVVGGSPIVVAASTLVVAALFQPLRTRVQRIVDRRFHRARYDAERTVAGFSGRLRDQLDLPTLTSELSRATVDAVEPSTTTVWLRPRIGESL